MSESHINEKGLSSAEVSKSRMEHGTNALIFEKENPLLRVLKSLLTEPMVVLLLVTSTIYFVLGEYGDGLFLTVAILMVAAISLFQDRRSRNALEKLNEISQPHCKVIRDGEVSAIALDEVVLGDSLMIEQGAPIAADGIIIHSNDFSVDESLLTGESLPVYKDAKAADRNVYRGTTVTGGLAIVRVTAIGNATRLGQIGKSLETVSEPATPLEIQIHSFIRKMTAAGIGVFFLVWGINFFKSHDILDSLLKALTLAMSILPEEIPVAFTTFMALGAWRLMKMGIVVKQMKTVETLGSATVICCDKTGTITRNEMDLVQLYVMKSRSFEDPAKPLTADGRALVRMGMWASEPIPFDPMEIALHEAYGRIAGVDDERPHYKIFHEYPLGGTPPMMTHLFADAQGNSIIAAKGAPEAFYDRSGLEPSEVAALKAALAEMAGNGYRVLGVGEAKHQGSVYPRKQQDFRFRFLGLLAFYDPPKPNIQVVFKAFREAGIDIKIVTGDNGITTGAIAKQIGFPGSDHIVQGNALMAMQPEEFQKTVLESTIFTRMFPEAKLRVIEALKINGGIVAMTGDGINDGPALKASNIGVAMGKKGTAIAKDAASLVLLEDDLSKMVDAVAMGRKIYANLKKAIQYVISIHIPIILVVFTPLALGWIYPNIFSPLHVILLELIMGPTCSIVYENEPMEKNTMVRKPRPFTDTFFNWRELVTSIAQGLAITVGALFVYQLAAAGGLGESVTRTMVFAVLLVANILLTLVNRSFYYSILTTLGYKNNLVFFIISITVFVSAALIYFRPFAEFFEFEALGVRQVGLCVATGIISVLWYELVKWKKRRIPMKAD